MSKVTTRYPDSVEPVYTDGRDIGDSLAELTGEAGTQISRGSTDKHIGSVAKTWKSLPEPQRDDPTYYDVPLLKQPVWEWAVPLYYYIGGLTGASLVLGAAAQLVRSERGSVLIEQCHMVGVAGSVISGVLLVYDLGKPSRFLNMLRVFRPTSPMNVGAWMLSGTGATATGAFLFTELGGWFRIPAKILGYAAGIFGAGLATYTGVLVANSAIPIWQESRKLLPLVFGSSALASLGCTFDMLTENEEQRSITTILGNVGRAAELIAGGVMEHQSSVVPRVGRPFKHGLSGVMWRTAELLTLASLVVSMAAKRTKRTRFAAGLLGTAGSLLLRYTVAHLGTVSSRDARASFHQQRARRMPAI